MHQVYKEAINPLLELVNAISKDALIDTEPDTLNKTIRHLKSFKAIEEVYFLDSNGNVLATGKNYNEDPLFGKPLSKYNKIVEDPKRELSLLKNGMLFYSHPYYNQGEYIGCLQLVLSMQSVTVINNELTGKLNSLSNSGRTNNLMVIGIAFFLIVCGVMIAIMSANRIQVKFKKIIDFSNNIAEGNLDLIYEVKNDDIPEFDLVGTAMNKMSKDLGLAFSKIKDQNSNLERIVEERTLKLKQKSRDIEIMLKSLQQGVFVIGDNEIVHQEYSAYLENILEVKSISGKNAIELIFADSNLCEDDISAMHSAIALIIGEKPINFVINQHFLLKSVEKNFKNNRKKDLDISWNVITDQKGIVDKLLISVRDVTKLKKLELEAEERRIELLMIGELLECGLSKAIAFFEKATVMAKSALVALESLTDDFKENMQTINLFDKILRNLHTIKGNSRTLKFTFLTEVIHRSEVEVKELKKNLKMQKDQFLSSPQFEKSEKSIKKADKTIRAYLEILNEKLSARREENPKIIKAMSTIEGLSNEKTFNTTEDKLHFADHVIKTIKFMRTDSLRDIVSEIAKNLENTASDLGIDNPNYKMNIDETIRFSEDQKSQWQNILIHCLSNSLDHGIAEKNDRTAKSYVFIDLLKKYDSVEINISDSGRGLNIDKLKQGNNQHLSDIEAAMSIFQPGISTKQNVGMG